MAFAVAYTPSFSGCCATARLVPGLDSISQAVTILSPVQCLRYSFNRRNLCNFNGFRGTKLQQSSSSKLGTCHDDDDSTNCQSALDAYRLAQWPASEPAAPLDVEIAAFCIPHDMSVTSASVSQSTTVEDTCVTAVEPPAFAVVEHLPFSRRASLLSYLDGCLHSRRSSQENQKLNVPVSSQFAPALAHGLEIMDAGVQSSAFMAKFESNNVVHFAWAGASGCLVIRDREVIFRSYQEQTPQDALENMYRFPSNLYTHEKRQRHERAGSNGVDHHFDSFDSLNRHWESSALDGCVQSTFLELQDGDLIIAGSQALFANISESQIISFVRPVADSNDPTLAIANATCLGSFRNDDVSFITYYLAHLADNFATSSEAKPILLFPFPPSPYLDDITVIAASCSFAR